MVCYLMVISGIFACSLSQLLLKRSANGKHQSRIGEIVNPLVIVAYGVFLCSLLINIWAMSNGVQLKEMALLESLGYIFVPLLSAVLLKEHVSRRMGGGILCLIVGIVIFYQ